MSTPTPTPDAAATLRQYVVRVDALPHAWQVAGTLLAGGAVAAVAYGLSEKGWAEIAATLLTAWSMQFARLVVSGRPPRPDAAFGGTRALLATVRADAAAFAATRTTLAKAVMAVGYAVTFVALRTVAHALLGAMTNLWFAVAIGLVVASVIASPVLWRAIVGSFSGAVAPATPAPAATTTPVEEAPAAPAVVIPALEPEVDDPR